MSNCCITGQPCTVEPCAKCPDHPIAEFHPWLDIYGRKAEYDRGDMAACWHAAQRALTAAQTEVATPSTIAGLEAALRYLTVGLEPHTAVTEAIRLLRTTVSPRARTETKDPTDTEFDPPSLR